MKKIVPYLLIALIVITAMLLLFGRGMGDEEKKADQRLTLRKEDKIPYGTYIAFKGLPYLFPQASISVNKSVPGYWDSLSLLRSNQALIIISPRVLADEFEIRKLVEFAGNGNDVFISTLMASPAAERILECDIRYNDISWMLRAGQEKDTMQEVLLLPSVAPRTYTYPGRRLEAYFDEINQQVSTLLGTTSAGQPNFIHLKAGAGNIYIHLSPLAFSNYFLLREGNMAYYEQVLSLISPDTEKIAWDEYYLRKTSSGSGGAANSSNNDSNWLGTALSYKSLSMGILTGLLLLLLYTLSGMRRRQRPIPVLARPRNDSLDFVRTIGRLYYEKGDHKNLARKMSAYFLEYLRSRYKLVTTELDETFIRNVQFKTGIEEAEVRSIVEFIRKLHAPGRLSDQELAAFHKRLEAFYHKA